MRCKYCLNRIKTSRFYMIFTASQLLITLALLVYILIDPIQNLENIAVLVLEILITIAIAFDIGVRIGVEKRKYFTNICNLLDFASFIILVILISIFYSAEMHKNVEIDTNIEEDDMIALCIIMIRYTIQLARFISTLKESQEIRDSMKSSEIKLDNFKATDQSTELGIDNHDFVQNVQNFKSQDYDSPKISTPPHIPKQHINKEIELCQIGIQDNNQG